MDLFKLKRFRRAHKPNPENANPVPHPEEPKRDEMGNSVSTATSVDTAAASDDDDDDDFITNEVKRRLKELRRNSFMVLIPEESCCPEEEEEDDDDQDDDDGETSNANNAGQWRDVEAEGRQLWSGFEAIYHKYCERMLYFDRLSAQQLNEIGCQIPSTSSPRSISKKLASPLRCLSLKKSEDLEDESEQLKRPVNDPYLDLETAYVAQVCLTWEALHYQYVQLSQKISCQLENSSCYNHSAQQFQQFQVLLQRFVENEPFEHGLRVDIYARTRKSLPKLLQVPIVKGSDRKEGLDEEADSVVLAPHLNKILECSVLTFHLFLKMDKKKSAGVRNMFGSQNQMAAPLQQFQLSLEKKDIKLKELRKKRKGWKKKSWPPTEEEVELLLSLIDVKVLSRVIRMARISAEQLFWCEEKMKKIDLTDGKLHRDPSPILFPC